MKVVVFSHGHPKFSKGGAELAAYYLFQAYNRMPDHEAWFIAREDDRFLHMGTPISALTPREYLISGHANPIDLTATVDLGRQADLCRLLQQIDPDVVHLHHYYLLSVDLIRAIRRTCPRARIVLTLHEYMAICMNFGQMVKTDGRLCFEYSPRDCNLCFPDRPAENIFLREQYIKSFFRLVDRFIAPSEFLRQRYIAWGLAPERIVTLENGLPPGDKVPPRHLPEDDIRGRFAYFGQINPFKGLDVVLEAFSLLPKKVRKQVSFDVYGSALHNQPKDYQDKIARLLEACGPTAHLHGPYEPAEMPGLMAGIDWVVMGSVWWENSPLVIQEAWKYGRPVICPDIGGMAEKVRDGVDGLHFRARDAVSLTAVMRRIVTEPDLFDRLVAGLPAYPAVDDVAMRHLDLYGRAVAGAQA